MSSLRSGTNLSAGILTISDHLSVPVEKQADFDKEDVCQITRARKLTSDIEGCSEYSPSRLIYPTRMLGVFRAWFQR
jgi:hypothetical protein